MFDRGVAISLVCAIFTGTERPDVSYKKFRKFDTIARTENTILHSNKAAIQMIASVAVAKGAVKN
jgi:hypothetical protein